MRMKSTNTARRTINTDTAEMKRREAKTAEETRMTDTAETKNIGTRIVGTVMRDTTTAPNMARETMKTGVNTVNIRIPNQNMTEIKMKGNLRLRRKLLNLLSQENQQENLRSASLILRQSPMTHQKFSVDPVRL